MWEAPGELTERVLAFLDEELVDEPGDEVGSRVMHGVRGARDDGEARVGE